MSKVTAFTLSTLRNEEILGMSLEIAEKLKNVIIVADSAQGKAFLDAIPAYASALDLEKTLTYKDLVLADAAVDQAITGFRMHLQALLGYPDDALRTRYDAFMAMMKSYDAERAAVQPGAVKNARQALVATWKPLCDLINGLAIVSSSDELESLIAEMNTRIQSKKTALKQRKSAKKTAKEVAQDIVDVEV